MQKVKDRQQNQDQGEKKIRTSGRSNWQRFNAKRNQRRSIHRKLLRGIPVRRLRFKQALIIPPRRIIQFNVPRVDPETVTRAAQTEESSFKVANSAAAWKDPVLKLGLESVKRLILNSLSQRNV